MNVPADIHEIINLLYELSPKEKVRTFEVDGITFEQSVDDPFGYAARILTYAVGLGLIKEKDNP